MLPRLQNPIFHKLEFRKLGIIARQQLHDYNQKNGTKSW